jgi:hypothetical protein
LSLVITDLLGTMEASYEAFDETLYGTVWSKGRILRRIKIDLRKREGSSTIYNNTSYDHMWRSACGVMEPLRHSVMRGTRDNTIAIYLNLVFH